ncbi:MAG TPA: penicillin-binding protein 2 [Candidatus Methylomirabilis sp.]|nr:penicillin-binding protein 2 [Candidatus Methylomirabilis sp.]
MHVATYRSQAKRTTTFGGDRLRWLQWVFLGLGALVFLRLFYLQVWSGRSYRLLASNQHELQAKLIPQRGRILVRDRTDGTLHPLATNRDAWTVYVVPKNMKDPGAVARELAAFAGKTEAELVATWTAKPDDPYEPVSKNLTTEQADVIRAKKLDGVGFVKGWARYYPEANIGGHLLGFVRPGDDGVGKGSYGIEGAFDAVLAGKPGFISAQKDAGGRRLVLDDGVIREAVNGGDVVLTIDRTIQHEACKRLQQAVSRYAAEGGSVVILDPQTGAVLAMCSTPDFNPMNYGATDDLNDFNNPVTFAQYEPGSVFKAFTMAVGLEEEKVTPKTTYVDTGMEEIDGFKIKNSDGKAHGEQTMTQVLDESLNTGTIFVQRQVGRDAFKRGIEVFGFGKPTGIGLTPEAKGDVSALSKKGSVFSATASFGQGLSVTPIQLVIAYAALANGGVLMRPYVVDEVIRPDGTREKTKPQTVGRAISLRAARLISGMLVSVVERGHGKRASVPGYYVAGKTGTAQVPDPKNPGYLKNVMIGSFAGFAPADNPRFVMLVKIDRPSGVQWAESSAAPLFGDIAGFLLNYLQVPTERDASQQKLPELPAISTSTGSVATGTTGGQ